MAPSRAHSAELSDRARDRSSEVYRAAMSYAEHDWPVLPGSSWNGRRFVIPGTFKTTDGLRPLVARNLASSDLETVTRWWNADTCLKPSVLLRSGEAFNLVSVAFELAQAAISVMDAHCQAGPVLYRPDQCRAYFFVRCEPLLSGECGRPGEVMAMSPGEWVTAPPTCTGNHAYVRWWCTPGSVSWCPVDVAVLADALSTVRHECVAASTHHAN